jgi:hypothetical protein
MKPATKLPWHIGLKQAERIVYDATGWAVCNATVYHVKEDADDCKKNAAYIAHACNAYPKLVEALREIVGSTPGGFAGDPLIVARRSAEALLAELGEQS